MTLREVCDFTYALMVADLRQEVLAERQAALIAGAVAGSRAAAPDMAEVQERFDAAIEADVQPADDTAAVFRLLGFEEVG